MASSHAEKDQDKDKPDEKKQVQVVIGNEDDGDDYKFNAKIDETVGSVIDELYRKKLRRERRADDRLSCEKGGENVLQFSDLTFAKYLAAGHCPGLSWLFSGGTGGA